MATWGGVLVVLIALSAAAGLVGCGRRSELTREPGAVWHLVVIGDSSLWRLGEAWASHIEEDTGVRVVLEDFALPTLSAGEVLRVLRGEGSHRARLEELPAALRDADLVVMFVNPRDSVDPEKPLDAEACFASRAPASCGPEALERWVTDLKEIWAEILALREGRPTVLRATDLYSPLVRPWREQGVLEECMACWENMSNAARSAAEAYEIPFLSRLDAFNGPNHDEDPREKGFIVSDGEHPSHLAAQQTAELLSRMGYAPVPAPE